MRILLTLLFASLIAGPLVYKRIEARNKVTASNDQGGAMNRYGFSFQESSKAAGVNFKYTPPVLDARLNHIMPEVASMGAAVSVVDFDRDGSQDFYVTNSGEGSKNALYHKLQRHVPRSRRRSRPRRRESAGYGRFDGRGLG